jgi:CheY-like chemotaxis protein
MEKQTDTLTKKRILLVEDERALREMVKLLLSQDGYAVVEANNGAEALGLFARGNFDLVMTDFEMPFIKGNELAAKIKQLSPRQPILMMTGYRHEPGPNNPVDAVLDKPFSFTNLRKIVGEIFSGAYSDGLVSIEIPGQLN